MSYPLLIILSILGYGIGSFFYKFSNENMHPLMVGLIVTSFQFLLSLIIFFTVKYDHSVNFNGILFTLIGSIFMAVGAITFFFALKGSGAGVTTALTTLYPAITLLLSFLFLKESLNFPKIVGILLALLSVFLLSK